MNKICEHCGKEIINPHNAQKHHKECTRIAKNKLMREYNNRPEIKKHYKEYHQRPEIKKRGREISKKWRKNNPEKIRKAREKEKQKPGYLQKQNEYTKNKNTIINENWKGLSDQKQMELINKRATELLKKTEKEELINAKN